MDDCGVSYNNLAMILRSALIDKLTHRQIELIFKMTIFAADQLNYRDARSEAGFFFLDQI